MKFYNRIFITFSLLFSLISCKESEDKKRESILPIPFPTVEVPVMYHNDLHYLAFHYWDNFLDTNRLFNAKDTNLFLGVENGDFSTAYNEYVRIIFSLPNREGMEYMSRLFYQVRSYAYRHPEGNAIENFSSIAEYYLKNPYSAYRNEDLYRAWIEPLSKSEFVDSLQKLDLQFFIDKFSKNERGTKASDFNFTRSNGRKGTLYGINSDYTLLMFTLPGCPVCEEVTEELKSVPMISQLIDNNQLTILNAYFEDDFKAWRDNLSKYPSNWVNCYNHDMVINDTQLYYVRATPSLYLLDKEKVVLFKDASLPLIMQYLSVSTMQ